jgi:hypothetical protein
MQIKVVTESETTASACFYFIFGNLCRQVHELTSSSSIVCVNQYVDEWFFLYLCIMIYTTSCLLYTESPIQIFVSLYLCLPSCLPIQLPIRPSTGALSDPSVHLYIYIYIYMWIDITLIILMCSQIVAKKTCLCIHISLSILVCLCIYLPIHLSVYVPLSISARLGKIVPALN